METSAFQLEFTHRGNYNAAHHLEGTIYIRSPFALLKRTQDARAFDLNHAYFIVMFSNLLRAFDLNHAYFIVMFSNLLRALDI